MNTLLTVTVPGRAHVTDLGRYGYAHIGIQTHGAVDQISARTANTLVGNSDRAALIEVTSIAAFEFTVSEPCLMAITGHCGGVTVDGLYRSTYEPLIVWAGARVRVWPGTVGVRAYVAIHGSFDIPSFLGSTARDALVGSGKELERGDRISVLDAQPSHAPTLPLFAPGCVPLRSTNDWTLGVVPGPELDQFPALQGDLGRYVFTVGGNSDHIGVRLEGEAFERTRTSEIVSRGVPLGAVEVPPVGGMIVLLRGRPLTAGYPVPFVVARSCHHHLGQLRPGDTVRLRWISEDESMRMLRSLESTLSQLRQRVTTMLDASALFPPVSLRESSRP